MKLKYTLSCLLFLMGFSSFGQSFERLDADFSSKGVAWDLALTGGLNAPQFSNVDLNNDGIEDLYIFDRAGSVHLTFLSDGSKYSFAPEYALNFPKLTNWCLLRDYNQDGIMDMFAASTVIGVEGIEVYTGFYENDKLAFERYQFPITQGFNLIYFPTSSEFSTQLYTSKVDLPAIDDVNCDGDLDVISFSVSGGYAHYFENQSVEKGYGLDSLIYEWESDCWGGFYESGLSPELELAEAFGLCSEGIATIEPRHAGSTLLTLDIDGDLDKDLILADLSFTNITLLYNGGTCERAWMNEQDVYFPSYDTPADVALFSAIYHVDLDHDGLKDLAVSPNDLNNANTTDLVWFYKATEGDDGLLFNLQQKDKLADRMVELGVGSNPTFVDYNADGLLDIVVGNLGYAHPSGNRDSRLALFENIGTSSTPAFEMIDDDYLGFSEYLGQAWNYAPAFGDMDGDGDMDLVVGSETGITFYAENIAGADQTFKFAPTRPNWFNINPGQATTPFVIDLDKDGMNDLLFGERNGNINFYPNMGTTGEPAFHGNANEYPNTNFVGRVDTREPPGVTGYAAPVIVEVNGTLKLITGSERGNMEMYTFNTDDISAEFQAENLDWGGIRDGEFTRLAIADLNNDGWLDALVGNERGGLTLYTTDLPSDSMVSTTEIGSAKIQISPNPAEAWVNVDLEDFTNFNTIDLLDIQGRVLRSQKVQAKRSSFDVSDLSKGLYFVQVGGENGIWTEKLVVQ